MPREAPFRNGFLPTEIRGYLQDLLPASYRTPDDDIAVPEHDLRRFLAKDISVDRLNSVHKLLWLAGYSKPPQPLTAQVSASREMIIDEDVNMHLVLERSRRLHLKPIPDYVLDMEIWNQFLVCWQNCGCEAGLPCMQQELYKNVLGFLYSYIALIQYKSDFTIAIQKQLLPSSMTWSLWKEFVRELVHHGAGDPRNISPRYRYGELKLSRLGIIDMFNHHASPINKTYSELFQNYVTTITVTTVYLVLVLTAMQVGLATDRLRDSDGFQRASYGFAVFSILGPMALLAFPTILGLVLVVPILLQYLARLKFRRDRPEQGRELGQLP